MGIMNTFGIGAPLITTSGLKIYLAYSIPLPDGHDMKSAVQKMSETIDRLQYGFEAVLRPTVDECDERSSCSAVHLYVEVPDENRDDPMRFHGLSYGLAVRMRQDLEAS